jgi:hypothetical protein
MMVLDALIREFNGHVAFRERRPGVLQVLAPLFHEDGDIWSMCAQMVWPSARWKPV